MKNSKIINSLLILSALNLTLMIPGGFIESRDFSHIPSYILGGFNIFLTVLGMLSFFIPYFIHKKRKWALWTAFICGLSYFIVYSIDLLQIFPKSPSPMPTSLFILEALGNVISLPLLFFAIKQIKVNKGAKQQLGLNKAVYWLIGLAILIALGIIIFATNAAMSGN